MPSKPLGKPVLDVTGKHWNYVAYEGPPGWFNRGGRKTELTKVVGSNAEWTEKKRVTTIGNTILIVRFKFKKFVARKVDDPPEGTITVTLTNLGPAEDPPPTPVVYDEDDPDAP